MDLLNLTAPHGTAWELLAVALVIIIGPILVERVRIPGLIGLLAGGCILGPNVLGVVSDSTGILHELGEVGLLYLMFLAGLELDLGVFARFKRQAVSFSLLTFAIPLALGFAGGLLIDYDVMASLLLGSLFASYTLVVYPTVRNMGLGANKAVAVTVGATVITDTLALVVLAVVAGSTTGSASGLELMLQIALGLVLLAVWCFVALPRIATWFFTSIGKQRTLRYVFVLAALLSAATLAEVVGIEAIVGAFFAGLALNRLVPTEGEFMERIEFFGSALLIPMFLVSVGTVIDPAVMVDPGTLGLAAVFVVACIGGKALAAAACRPLFSFSWDEIGVVFGLSVAQAAATLAATFVGLDIGLFTTATVNAVMIVIVVSLVLASASAEGFGRRIPRPPIDATRIGRSVLLQLEEPDDARAMLDVAARVANADGGVVRPVVVVPDGGASPSAETLEAMAHRIDSMAVDAEVEVRHDRTTTDGLLHTASSFGSSFVVVPAATQAWLPTLLGAAQHALVASSAVPVALVRPGTARAARVVLILAAAQAKRPTTAAQLGIQVAGRLHRDGLPLVVVADGDVAPGLLDPLGAVSVVDDTGPAWLEAEGAPSDIVVVPAGRNGAFATARTTKHASTVGCTIVAVADRTSVTSTDRAADGLGLVVPRSVQDSPDGG